MYNKKYNTMEKWKDIIGFEGFYQVSDTGKVRSLDRVIGNRQYKGTEIKPLIGYGGYYSVQLRKKIKKTVYYIHRLVAIHFVENIENKKIINHIDENKINNNSNNLEWVTVSENTIHSNKGAGFLTRKFNKEQIESIRLRHEGGETIYSICKDLKENAGTISNIIRNKTYKKI